MSARRGPDTVAGAMRRLLCCLLVALFSAGFLPSRHESCGCTAERNCGCSCWRERSRDSGGVATVKGERACCPLSRGARGRGREARRSLRPARAPHGGRSDGAEPLAPAPDHATRRTMEWILAEVAPPGPPAFVRRRDLPAVAAGRKLGPPLPPPLRRAPSGSVEPTSCRAASGPLLRARAAARADPVTLEAGIRPRLWVAPSAEERPCERFPAGRVAWRWWRCWCREDGPPGGRVGRRRDGSGRRPGRGAGAGGVGAHRVRGARAAASSRWRPTRAAASPRRFRSARAARSSPRCPGWRRRAGSPGASPPARASRWRSSSSSTWCASGWTWRARPGATASRRARSGESFALDAAEALGAVDGVAALRKGAIAGDVVLRGFKGENLNVVIDGQHLFGACPNHMDPPAFHVDFAEIERIEVVKGPHDVAYGGGLGGTVNIVTRDPDAGATVMARLSAGTAGLLAPAASASWAGPRWSVKGGAAMRRGDPYEDGDGVSLTELLPLSATAAYRAAAREERAFDLATAWAGVEASLAPGARLELSVARQDGEQQLYPYLQMDAEYDRATRALLRYRAERRRRAFGSLEASASWSRVDHAMDDRLRVSSSGAPRAYGMRTVATSQVAGGRIEVGDQPAGDAGSWRFGLEGYDRRWDAATSLAGMGYRPQASLPDVGSATLGLYAELERRARRPGHPARRSPGR